MASTSLQVLSPGTQLDYSAYAATCIDQLHFLEGTGAVQCSVWYIWHLARGAQRKRACICSTQSLRNVPIVDGVPRDGDPPVSSWPRSTSAFFFFFFSLPCFPLFVDVVWPAGDVSDSALSEYVAQCDTFVCVCVKYLCLLYCQGDTFIFIYFCQ